MASAEIALVCGLKVWVGCQDKLRVNLLLVLSVTLCFCMQLVKNNFFTQKTYHT